MERRLALLKEKGYFRTVDREQYASLFDFYDIETPGDVLIEKSAGVYFFQSDPDPDGLQRKYPLVGIYEDRIFPAASLAMALRHYGVSFNDVEIVHENISVFICLSRMSTAGPRSLYPSI